jgi:hypothetical protein
LPTTAGTLLLTNGSGAALTDLTAANIAAGTLDADVMASSAALSLFYSADAVRTNLGLAIGSNVQAYDAQLDDLADGSLSGAGTVADTALSANVTKLGEAITLDEVGAGAAGANAYDFGGATSLEIPNSAAVTVDATGEIGVDTTAGQLLFYDGTAARALNPSIIKSMTIDTPTDADNFIMFRTNRAITIHQVDCITGAATSAVVTVQECNADAGSCGTVESLTCGATNTQSTSIDDGAIDAGDYIRLDVGTVTGTVGQVNVNVMFRENPL